MFLPLLKIFAILLVAVCILNLEAVDAERCVPRNFNYGSIVCVCNSTYCDSTSRKIPERGQYRSYESNESGERMSEKVGRFENNSGLNNEVEEITIILNHAEKFQKIHGFGGAFTDSAGINIKKLSEATQQRLLETYFGADGSGYNLGRVPIGGTDFSTRGYTYDDEKDETLANFSLAEEDFNYKIPLMQEALKINPSLKFLSVTWSPPGWMKTNDALSGYGFLKEEYYQTYADYLLKFLMEYKRRGLKMWLISTGNEPLNAAIPFDKISSMGWTAETVANWIADNLGPTIAASESNDTGIIIIDDQRIHLPWFVSDIFENSLAKNYTAGIAVHWYTDRTISPSVLDETHNLYPDKFLIMTEACVGSLPTDIPKVRLGDWQRGERYILDIIENLNHWMTGWIDWNLALDKTGGPTWIDNNVDSPIIVIPETDEFFKQPTYYALAHFSKFITRGSTRIGTTENDDIENVAFLTPDDEIIIVLYNSHNAKKKIALSDPEQGTIRMILSPLSITTIVYKR